jgi:hypothetical protein
MSEIIVYNLWCGYCGHFVNGSQKDFIDHLHTCELKLCERIKNDRQRS